MFDIIKKFIRTIPIPLSKNHAYDLQTINVIKKHCLPNSNCIDIGCHKGEILDLILQHAPHGQHFAFEPLPDFYKNLKKKYQQYPNVKIFDIALNNNKGKTTFNYVISNPAYSGIVKRKYDRANEKDMLIEVIADFLENIKDPPIKIDFIKIDVEGGEYQVLLGAEKTILHSKPIIIFEHGKGASDWYGTKPENIFDFFVTKNYHVATMHSWLNNGPNFTLQEFVDEFEYQKNYYFIAFPAK